MLFSMENHTTRQFQEYRFKQVSEIGEFFIWFVLACVWILSLPRRSLYRHFCASRWCLCWCCYHNALRRLVQIRQGCLIDLLPLPLPIPDMLQHDPGRALRRVLASDALDEIALGIHHVEVDAVVDQVVLLVGLDVLRRREVDPVLLADVLDLLPGAGQPDEGGVELHQVRLEHAGGVARRVAGDEYGSERVRGSGLDYVDRFRHLVELVWADVRAVGEAEVDLQIYRKS